jgi:poly(A) polymerase
MMVARVCQFYPNAVGATLVNKFFFIMGNWKWPTPVELKDSERPTQAQLAQGLKVWNPKIYPGDLTNLMPIITPAFPSMCATYNISESGKKVIVREIQRASRITNDIFAGKATWADLFQKHTFFTTDHKHYLGVIASAMNPDAAKAWSGMVESKVRIFVQELEKLHKSGVTLARPFTKGFKRVHKCMNDDEIREVQKGSMKYKFEETKTVETTDPELVTSNGNGAALPSATTSLSDADKDAHLVYTYTFYVGLDVEEKQKENGPDGKPKAREPLNLIPAFKRLTDVSTERWVPYNPEVHFLHLAHIKR